MSKTTKLRRGGRVRTLRGVKPPRRPTLPFAPHAFESRLSVAGSPGSPTVFITPGVYSRMWHLVDIAENEVGWFGTVQIVPGGFLIDEVFLMEQEVSAAQIDVSAESFAKLVEHLIQTRSDGVDLANRLFFHGHSHVNMPTSPSPADERHMDDMRDNGCPYFIRAILNKRGRMEFTILFWQSAGMEIEIRDAPWAIYAPVDASVRDEIEAEFNAKVSKRAYQYPAPGTIIAALSQDGQPEYITHPDLNLTDNAYGDFVQLGGRRCRLILSDT